MTQPCAKVNAVLTSDLVILRVLVELIARLVVMDATIRSVISAMMLSTRIQITRAVFFLL